MFIKISNTSEYGDDKSMMIMLIGKINEEIIMNINTELEKIYK